MFDSSLKLDLRLEKSLMLISDKLKARHFMAILDFAMETGQSLEILTFPTVYFYME